MEKNMMVYVNGDRKKLVNVNNKDVLDAVVQDGFSPEITEPEKAVETEFSVTQKRGRKPKDVTYDGDGT